MLHACGRIDILKKKVIALLPDDNMVPINIHHSIRVISEELQDVYDFVADINITSRSIYEMTLKLSSVIIPITALLIIEEIKHKTVRGDFVFILAATLLFSSLPCYYGNLLMTKSLDLREAVYFSGWERVWDRRTRSSLLVLMTRMERAIAIRSVFHVMNHETLADVFKTSYRLFSLLTAAWTIEY
ncbi:hypothetical protein O0L34_g2048 [Tuta absoluta]|nr:hypothetical protein O0L34_g2048 [Tuta absoluta]